MRKLRHPNILQMLGIYVTNSDVCLVMEFASRGSMHQIIHSAIPLPWNTRLKAMLLDTCRGMCYLHESNPVIVHRDLKSHNLMVFDNWTVKVGDFGMSRIIDPNKGLSMTACGTPSWTAPEILKGSKYTHKADVYSFAIVFYECVARKEPYDQTPSYQIVLQVAQGYRPVIPENIHSEIVEILQECWAEDPDSRPSFSDIILKLDRISM